METINDIESLDIELDVNINIIDKKKIVERKLVERSDNELTIELFSNDNIQKSKDIIGKKIKKGRK